MALIVEPRLMTFVTNLDVIHDVVDGRAVLSYLDTGPNGNRYRAVEGHERTLVGAAHESS